MKRAVPLVVVGLLLGCGGDESPVPGGTAGSAGAGGTGGGSSDPCPPPGRLVEGECLDPGVADDGCPAGTTLVAGTCLAAGIPSDGCGTGFTHDGDVSCVPILPPGDCATDGEMAVPGDATCRPIMDCGTGQWGNIPVDSNTIYVDVAYTGGNANGTAAQPYPIINQAIAAAQGGELIAIAAGTYVEDVVVDRLVTLHGVCPDQTVIQGDPNSVFAAVSFIVGSNGAAVIGVTATEPEPSPGIGSFGASDVTIDRVRVTGSGTYGVLVTQSEGVPSALTITDSLIDQNGEYGVITWGSEATIEGTQIRDTQEVGGTGGIGVEGLIGDGAASVLTIRGSLIEGGAMFGVSLRGSPLVLEDSVVRDIQPKSTDDTNGRGVNVQFEGDDQARAAATISRSVITDNHSCGIFAASSDVALDHSVVAATHYGATGQGTGLVIQRSVAAQAQGESQLELTASVVETSEGAGLFVSKSHASLERVVVRDTLPAAIGDYGRGIYLRIDESSPDPVATMTLLGSVVDHNTDVGVFVAGAELTMDGTIVSNTQPDNELPTGRGISVQRQDILGTPARLTVRGSVIEDNMDTGIFVGVSEVTIGGTIVRNTALELDGDGGRGISIQHDSTTGAPASATITSTLIDNNHDAGLFLISSSLDLSRSKVSRTQPAGVSQVGVGMALHCFSPVPTVATITDSIVEDSRMVGLFNIGSQVTVTGTTISGTQELTTNGQPLYGDGIAVLDYLTAPASLTVTDSRITENARGGLLYYSGTLVLGGTALSCNAIDLLDNSESGIIFDNQGGNTCGCPGGSEECKWLSSDITPPAALPPKDPSGDG